MLQGLQQAMSYLSRRDFLKRIGIAGTSAATLGPSLLIALGNQSCQGLQIKEEGPVIYPPLNGQKIQPPADGCFIGFHYFRDYDPNYYGKKLGFNPKIAMKLIGYHSSIIYQNNIQTIADTGAYPFYYRPLNEIIFRGNLNDLIHNKEFRKSIEEYAKNIAEMGIPLFISTMREPNGDWFPWGKQPSNFKKMWKLMWQIFEDKGANEYATWVWEVNIVLGNIDNPHRYYPGNKYVDWIGLSAYSRNGIPITNESFSTLVANDYFSMRKNYPNKPIMMAEFGKSQGSSQPRWIQNAYETIRNWPGMKAAIYWNVYDFGLDDDANLSNDSYKVLRELLKDPYFIKGNTKPQM